MEGEDERPMSSKESSSVEVERSSDDEKEYPQSSAQADEEEVLGEKEAMAIAAADEPGCSNALFELYKKKSSANKCPVPAKRRKVIDNPPDKKVRDASVSNFERLQKEWKSAALYSRACSICSTESPRQRSVFTACGHSVCRACAEQLAMDAGARQPACPYCRKESVTVRLFEDDPDCYNEPKSGTSQEHGRLLDKYDADCMKAGMRGGATSLCTARGHRCYSRQSWIAARKDLVDSFLREEINETAYVRRYNDKLESEVKYREARGGCPDAVYEEEYRRLDNELPQGASRCRLADCAADAARRREKLHLIGVLKTENEENASSGRKYTRACGRCQAEAPIQRSVMTECGHAVCRACAESMVAADPEHLAYCPFCYNESAVINLFEDLI